MAKIEVAYWPFVDDVQCMFCEDGAMCGKCGMPVHGPMHDCLGEDCPKCGRKTEPLEAAQ
jgi:hypothetical protein